MFLKKCFNVKICTNIVKNLMCLDDLVFNILWKCEIIWNDPMK